ncbi:hypothetical protein acdb102_46780 [Acidothermaceae bacterium B102]|nr:hypothetical protein acdb102_46780 [Acidothermaceae bacterium B102]
MTQGSRARRLHGSFVETTNSRTFVLAFWTFWFAFCVGGVLLSYHDAATLRDHGLRAEAVVTDVHDIPKDSYVTVQFSTRTGRSVSAQVGNWDWSPEPRVGEVRTVIYDASDPSGLVADARQGPAFIVTWIFAGGLVGSSVLFVLTYTRRIDWSGTAKRRGG